MSPRPALAGGPGVELPRGPRFRPASEWLTAVCAGCTCQPAPAFRFPLLGLSFVSPMCGAPKFPQMGAGCLPHVRELRGRPGPAGRRGGGGPDELSKSGKGLGLLPLSERRTRGDSLWSQGAGFAGVRFAADPNETPRGSVRVLGSPGPAPLWPAPCPAHPRGTWHTDRRNEASWSSQDAARAASASQTAAPR